MRRRFIGALGTACAMTGAMVVVMRVMAIYHCPCGVVDLGFGILACWPCWI